MKPYLRLRQICVAAPALEPAVQQIRDLFGLEVCFRDENVAKYGLVNALFVFGHAFLEIVAPTREGTAAGRFIERSKGVGGYMAIFDCDDPLARRARAEAMGVRIAHVLDYPTFFGSQLHPRDCRATMLEFDHTVDGEKLDGHYHPAGPHWQQFQRLDRVSGISQIEVNTPDPAGLAAFWGQLMDRPVGTGPSMAPQITFDLGSVAFTPGATGSTSEALASMVVTVPDPNPVRERAARLGLLNARGEVNFAGMAIRLETA